MSSTATDPPATSAVNGLKNGTLPAPTDNPAYYTENQGPIIFGVTVAFSVLSSIVVGLRLYTRYGLIKFAGSDDVTIVVAHVLSLALSAATILQTHYGLGRHFFGTSESDVLNALKSLLGAEIVYNLSQTVTKLSLLLQYRRIFTGKWTKAATTWFMVFLIVWGIITEILVGLACVPVALFIPSRADECIEASIVWYLTSAVNIVTDFLVLIVPIPATWALQLRRRQRLMLTCLFGLGFLTVIVSIGRVFTLEKTTTSTDPSWDGSATAYLSVIELNIGIMCASLATLRPLLWHWFPNTFKSSMNRTGPTVSGKTAGGTTTKQKNSSRGIRSVGNTALSDNYSLDDIESITTVRENDSQENLREDAGELPPHLPPQVSFDESAELAELAEPTEPGRLRGSRSRLSKASSARPVSRLPPSVISRGWPLMSQSPPPSRGSASRGTPAPSTISYEGSIQEIVAAEETTYMEEPRPPARDGGVGSPPGHIIWYNAASDPGPGKL